MSNPSNNKSHHFPCTSVAAPQAIFRIQDNIHSISKPCVVAASSSLKQAMHSQITPPRKKIPHKELADKTSRKINKPRPCSDRKNDYVDKMDCSSSCCCGCKLENVDARKSGGKVCWKRLKIFTILFLVSSVASSVPLHKTYSRLEK